MTTHKRNNSFHHRKPWRMRMIYSFQYNFRYNFIIICVVPLRYNYQHDEVMQYPEEEDKEFGNIGCLRGGTTSSLRVGCYVPVTIQVYVITHTYVITLTSRDRSRANINTGNDLVAISFSQLSVAHCRTLQTQ